LAAWLSVSVVGYFVAMRYDFQPGPIGTRQVEWPGDSAVSRSADTLTVLAFIHPRCPCTSATISELIEAIHARPGADLAAVVFVPSGHESDAEWSDTKYLRRIRAEVPGARIYLDPAGREIQRFGVETSGTILVFNPAGHEVFRGGITSSRGVVGDNPGRRQFENILAGIALLESDIPIPVFGCSLKMCDRAEPAMNQGGAP
jgi:hypothetical protein